MNCLIVSAYFIESARLFQSLGAAIEKALSPYVLVDDIGTIKSLCLREWGRLGNGGRPISLKIGTHGYYEDLCNVPKFQLHCPYLG